MLVQKKYFNAKSAHTDQEQNYADSNDDSDDTDDDDDDEGNYDRDENNHNIRENNNNMFTDYELCDVCFLQKRQLLSIPCNHIGVCNNCGWGLFQTIKNYETNRRNGGTDAMKCQICFEEIKLFVVELLN